MIPLSTFIGFLFKARSFANCQNMGMSPRVVHECSILQSSRMLLGYYLSVQLSQTNKETLSALKPAEPALPGGKCIHIVLMQSACFFGFCSFF